jgi:IS605 OrfB family transposase
LQLKLLPTPEDDATLQATMQTFNAACTYIAEVAYREQLASKFKLQRLVYYEVKERFQLTAQLVIRAIAKVVEAYKRDKSTQVTFRPDGAVVYDKRICSFHGLESVSLATIAGRRRIPIQMGDYQRVQFSRAKGQADLIRVGGVFYLLVTLDTPQEPPIQAERFMGIDLGIVNIAVDSTGKTYSGAAVERVRQRCACHRRTYQATGTKRAKRRLKQLSRKESRFRRDVNHQIAKELVVRAQGTKAAIALEDLTGISDRTTVRKSQRNRHKSWSFRQLAAFIVYKAQRVGIRGCWVDPRNTSRECSKCGYVDKRNRPTQEKFSCLRCGYTAPADYNAARNLATRGTVSCPDLIAPRLGQLAFAW